MKHLLLLLLTPFFILAQNTLQVGDVIDHLIYFGYAGALSSEEQIEYDLANGESSWIVYDVSGPYGKAFSMTDVYSGGSPQLFNYPYSSSTTGGGSSTIKTSLPANLDEITQIHNLADELGFAHLTGNTYWTGEGRAYSTTEYIQNIPVTTWQILSTSGNQYTARVRRVVYFKMGCDDPFAYNFDIDDLSWNPWNYGGSSPSVWDNYWNPWELNTNPAVCPNANTLNYDFDYETGFCGDFYNCMNFTGEDPLQNSYPSCNYLLPNFIMNDGSCCYTAGCMNSSSYNYNASACYDDGSCEAFNYDCTDPQACNYNPNANTDNGSCIYTDGVCDTCENEIVVDNDTDNDGICDQYDNCPNIYNFSQLDSDGDGWGNPCDNVYGCNIYGACNYNEFATENDGSCVYSDNDYDCDGNCFDADEDGICNFDEVDGCTDETACNYNAAATEDNGTCDQDSDGDGFCNMDDNCPYDYNPNQLDYDNDDIGDECDTCNDLDLDQWCDDSDPCINDPDNDIDGDGLCADVDECPSGGEDIDGFYYLGEFEGSLYYLSQSWAWNISGNAYYISPEIWNGPFSWTESSEICEQMGGHLTTITSSDEKSFLINALNTADTDGSGNADVDYWWFGLYQNTESPTYSEPSGGWEWVTGEEFCDSQFDPLSGWPLDN
ncbi:MAG: hypothetical protein CMP54_03010, partial [Flavobacteriales bacterium]|nr:hypothetical protein [Flavobacteriales bacterium]